VAGFEYIDERNEALFQAYKDALKRKDVKTHQDAVNAAIHTPTKRYWVSPHHACRKILKYKKLEKSGNTRPIREEAMQQIYKIYQQLEDKPTFRGASAFFITTFAIQHQAPQFFISQTRAGAIISRMKRRKRNNK
jgi:hypothetical protein